MVVPGKRGEAEGHKAGCVEPEEGAGAIGDKKAICGRWRARGVKAGVAGNEAFVAAQKLDHAAKG